MEIRNPRRLLALGAPESGVLTLLRDLTGSAPTPVDTSTAGLTHDWHLTTKYYTATLSIWIDEIPSLDLWRTEFTRPEAREVVTALGAWIYCFRKPITRADVDRVKDVLSAIAEVIERACGYAGADMCCLAVAMPQSITPYLEVDRGEWEDACMDSGFEFVDWEEKGVNEFGEAMGVDRVREALEATEWEGGDSAGFGFDDENEDEYREFTDGEGGLNAEEREMGLELWDLKEAVHGFEEEGDGEGEEQQVEELESLMRRMVAIKETSEAMPEEARKRFAAKAVNDLMKDL